MGGGGGRGGYAAILYSNRNNIDMIRLVELHVPSQNKNMEYRRH